MPFELIASIMFVAGVLVGMLIQFGCGLMADADERHARRMAAYDRELGELRDRA